MKKIFLISFICICSSILFAQENNLKIQIREPQKLIVQIDKYVFGNGLHAKETDPFFSPIQQALMTTIQVVEPMIGVKVENLLMVLNGNIDITLSEEKIFRFRADYASNEMAEKNVNTIKSLFASRAGILLSEKKEGELICYSDDVNSSLFMSLLNNSLYLQIGNFNLTKSGPKDISYSILPIAKSEVGANFNFQISPEFMKKATKEFALLNSIYGQGINYNFSLKDNYIEVHSELKLPKNGFIQAICPQNPLSPSAYQLISLNAKFAVAAKFNFSQLLQSLALLKEYPELKEFSKNIELARQNFTQFTKLDLQNDILNHLGDEIVISAIPEEEAGGNPLFGILQLNSIYIGLPVKNSNAFETSLVKLLTSIGQLTLAMPISSAGDGLRTIQMEGAKIYYLRFLQGLLTPCFMVKENKLLIATNIATLEYINKNEKTWGSLANSKEFQNKVPIKNATVFYYDKYTGDSKRPNYLAHLTTATTLGALIAGNYMGDIRINPAASGLPISQFASLIKPIVSAIDFTQYPATKYFQQPYGDNYAYWVSENNSMHFYQKSGHLINGSVGLLPMIGITSMMAAITVPQLLEARRNSNQRAVIGTLRSFATDQETYLADNTTYGTLKQITISGKINLLNSKFGYTFSDIIKSPDGDFYAVLASPTSWGVTGKYHYFITSSGVVRCCNTKELPFKLPMDASEKTIETINELPEAK